MRSPSLLHLPPPSPASSAPAAGCHRSRAWLAVSSFAAAAALFTTNSTADTLAGWDFSPLTGGSNNFGTSPLPATTSLPAVTVGGLTRGPGAGTTGTGAGNAWGGNAWEGTTTAAASIDAGDYITFSITANAGNQLSLSSLGAFNIRRSASGPSTGQIQYQIGAGSFVDIGTPITWGGTTTATGNPQAAVNLLGIAALQNVPPGITVTFRIANYGATTSGGTWYLNDPLDTAADDFTVVGTLTPSGADTTPPTVVTLAPADNATGVAVAGNLAITFSEPVAAGAGNVVLYKVGDPTPAQTFTAASGTISGNGYTVTFDPTADLAFATGYYLKVDGNAFVDLATPPNAFGGIADETTWNFTTIAQDVTPPTVSSFSPAAGSVDVAPPTKLVITFNEPVQQTLASKNLVVKDSLGNTAATVDVSIFGSSTVVTGQAATVTLPASTPLDYGKSYHVQIEAGAFADGSGNEYAGIGSSDTTTWTFSTVDVPPLTTAPYVQSFSAYNSAATLPTGWSFSGASNLDTTYRGDWGTVTPDPSNAAATLGGFKGNASVFGYHHTSLSNTTNEPLVQTLTLRNNTGNPITDLTVTYKGRVHVLENTRIPVFAVNVAGTDSPALAYSTADGDNAQRNASVSGLNIAVGQTFQIKWSSAYPAGSGSARQIGISDVHVSAGASTFAPTVVGLSVPVASIGGATATVNANVTADGGQAISARGFVYSVTSVNSAPALGGAGVTAVADGAPGTGSFSTGLSGLSSGVNYSVRAYATNSTGTSYTTVANFTTLASSPVLVTSYNQEFSGITGNSSGITNMPAGWTAISDFVPPLQTFAGTWGTTSNTGGFLGNDTTPGVLGYRHTGSSGNLTVTLHLVNGTGATLTKLNVSYLGRMKYNPAATNPADGRNPIWAVSVNGSAPIPELAYDTNTLTDATKSTTVTGLSIAAGAEFTITWTSSRGDGSGSSKQIGIANVLVSTDAVPGNTYDTWAATNVNGQPASGDFDGDGLGNGTEYFMGTAGNAFTANPGIVAGKVTWPRAAGTTISSFKVEVSTNLTTWENATVNYNANLSITASQVQFTMPTTPAKLFVRLSVTP